MKIKLLHYLIITFISLHLNAQNYPLSAKKLTFQDSICLINLPQLTLPENYKGTYAPQLPAIHDNSELPFLRPPFLQYSYSCGQASSIGYNFTYEINRVRNLPAKDSANQYPPLFTWNFFNNAENDVGVCFYYTWEAIKSNGQPNVIEYGGMGDNQLKWMTGYEKYYNGMNNRISDVYSIYVGDSNGLITLKYWLFDHLNGSEYGSLANFYTDYYTHTFLPPGTPEEGKCVVTQWGPYSGHSMTIVGWNDSIRYDYNNDGLYTNDVDINEDGIINMKDWEIGGLKFINSYSEWWADSGFCYMMYKTLAEEKLDGGIWNKSVYIIEVKEDYSPTLAYKVKLKHSSRNKIKVSAGVSNDTTDVWTAHILDFPIFNYQGGNHYMQGIDIIEANKTIEFGLDVTPLISYINPGEPVKFFIQVKEHDPYNFYNGSLLQYSLMDYSNGLQEIVCSDTNVTIIENGYTTLSVVHQVNINKVNIDTEELPPCISGQQYTHQMSASGGTEPYKWQLLMEYSENQYEDDYPAIQGQQLNPNGSSSGYAIQAIEFPFPFYGNMYDTVTIHVDGFLMFDTLKYPIPYQVDDMFPFKYESMLAPFFNQDLIINSSAGNGLWYEGNANYAAFRWIETLMEENGNYQLDFTAILYPDGNIEYYFDNFNDPEYLYRITGISNGDGINYQIAGFSNLFPAKSPQVVTYTPQNYISSMNINDEGLLTVLPDENNKIYNITIKATDYHNISDSKTFQLSDGIVFYFTITSGDDNRIDYGETPVLSFAIKNTGNQPVNNVILTVQINDLFITMTDSTENIGTIYPGQTIYLPDAISFSTETGIPDNYNLTFDVIINTATGSWEGSFNVKAYAPVLSLGSPFVDDNDNGIFDPGETVNLIIPVNNYGHSNAIGVEGLLTTYDTYISLNSSNQFYFGNIPKGSSVYDTINISVANNTPQGHSSHFDFEITALPDFIIEESFDMLIGRYPILIIDMDPKLLSGPVIKSTLEELNVLFDYLYYIPGEPDIFQNIFIVLGRMFGQHILTEYEGQKLADFLNTGGNIYMEGGMTWFDDPQTAVHPMFNINTVPLTWNLIDTVSGIINTFTEGLSFTFSGDMPYYNYYLEPVEPAYTILQRASEQHGFAVAYNNGNYKTIGSIIDFSGLNDSLPPSTKNNLMMKMLIFFGLDTTSAINKNYYDLENRVLFCYPNPTSENTTISFLLTRTENIYIDIYDIHGVKVSTLLTGKEFPAGKHSVLWDGKKFSNGIYICRLKTEKNISTEKIIKF
ncbi:MAG: T9SS type A sorting domain-containing protein [Bacteroidetes bacterium]|nr:T9SS type A sorting domain-containing protein [Bacteroidota bacterium]MBL7104556.1 T9SS type A sorting domain-containing protein [Bacteroidales bacterium]